MKNILLVFLYSKLNRYSINSLLSSLQTSPELISCLTIKLAYNEDEIYSTLETQLKNYKKIIICISFTTSQLLQMKLLLNNLLRYKNDKLFLLCGGPHPTGQPQTALNLGFDIVVLHEAEEVFIKLLKKLINNEDYSDLPNLYFLNHKKQPVKTKIKISNVNLDNFSAVADYFNRYGPIEITRGCPYCCSFCQTPQIFGTKLRHRSIQKICESVEIMASKGLYDTRFITPSLFLYGATNTKKLNLPKLEELFCSVSKIIKPKGKLFIGTFPSELRPEHINKDTVELLRKYADNDNVIVGVQSGSERILQLCNRQHTISDVYNAVEILTQANFKVNLDFIFGLPFETKQDLKETINVIDELVNKYKVRIHAHKFTPLPQTKFENLKFSDITPIKEYLFTLKIKGYLYGNFL
ncbi:MAG: TIGR04013 family B12-binding domain/radical SAM domain-containing protein [Endomicrobia bacterium]|nr:TIGR04013 family B12-binding domain/radical SAM domain-containing protein [Endomicrobiia bacterium]